MLLNQRLHLLLIDDDTIDCELVRRLLGPTYTVDEASTGQLALARVQAHRPDCVLLDYRLPDMDGLDVLQQLVQATLPVILLTGEERPAIIVRAMQLGAQDYLLKQQLTQFALEQAITQAIVQVRLQQAVQEQQQQLRAFATALTLAEQQERHRIALLLHDGGFCISPRKGIFQGYEAR